MNFIIWGICNIYYNNRFDYDVVGLTTLHNLVC
jgi:hypothetical protein